MNGKASPDSAEPDEPDDSTDSIDSASLSGSAKAFGFAEPFEARDSDDSAESGDSVEPNDSAESVDSDDSAESPGLRSAAASGSADSSDSEDSAGIDRSAESAEPDGSPDSSESSESSESSGSSESAEPGDSSGASVSAEPFARTRSRDSLIPEERNRFILTDRQRVDWLRLIRCENIGPATFRELLNHFGGAGKALEHLPALIRGGGAKRKIRIASRESAEEEIERVSRIGARFIGMGEPDYPPLLRKLSPAPPMLCVKGDSDCFNRPSVSVVGSRNASLSGLKIAERFSTELSESGHVIVSGLARGIDSTAHRHSLEGGTIAVLAGGIDKIYPEENEGLAEEIIANGGALITESPFGSIPRGVDFPRRNRIIAGLSLGVLVVEAARRSGSLITARLATEAGRLVFAIPGSPLDPRAQGSNHLIKTGSQLVDSTEDIIVAMRPLTGGEPQLPFDAGEPEEQYEIDIDSPPIEASRDVLERIVEGLGPSPMEVDDVVRLSGAGAGEVQSALLQLRVAGRLEDHPGNRISLKPE